MNKPNSIVLIVPYYGEWPQYVNLFLKTSLSNPMLDIVLVTDLPPIKNTSSNIIYYHLSFNDLKIRIRDLFNLKELDIKPYKLCDYRPAYGVIFNDIIKEYDFWGYGDLDLIYGDLKQFLTINILKSSDIIAFRGDHLHGPFTLYRNTEVVNRLFERGSYKEIFNNSNYLSFDEFGQNGFHIDIQLVLDKYENDNISIIALKAQKLGEIQISMNPVSKEVICDTKEVLKYERGKIISITNNKEYAFYHWVWEKRAVWFKLFKENNTPDTFYISETGFYSESTFRFYYLIHFYRKFAGLINWLWLKGVNYLKRKLGYQVVIDTYPRMGFIKKIE